MCRMILIVAALSVSSSGPVSGGVGDPQVKTDHPWYPGELACSTFARLKQAQSDLFTRVVGRTPQNDEDRALASWLWRSTHYWHGEPGATDLWDDGFQHGLDTAPRDNWTGLFAHGFGLCGTTHAQWTAEMHELLGHNRGRVVGVSGHNSFDVFLTGHAYGSGQWALLDHDISTILFDRQGKRLDSISELSQRRDASLSEAAGTAEQHGWPVCGLHRGDGVVFDRYQSAEYFAGYAGPAPMVHLRRGESLKRFLHPGLEDGKTFVFWGRNSHQQEIPGPARARTWVNQPETLFPSTDIAAYHPGQARYANAVYRYEPDFVNGTYREGVADESDEHVTFTFHTPYVIAATPANDDPWGIYQPGCRNGLVISGRVSCPVSLSVNGGATWHDAGALRESLDLTDQSKGHSQYLLRLHCGGPQLIDSGLVIRTVCQMNSSVIPRLKSHGTDVIFQATGQALVSAGPVVADAEQHLVDGAFHSSRAVLSLSTPRGEPATQIVAAARWHSSNPPDPQVAYYIDWRWQGETHWRPIVDDWRITRQAEEPSDFWSQSFCWGRVSPTAGRGGETVEVRFRNNGGKRLARAEMHLLYPLAENDPTRVTFCWKEAGTVRQASHVFDVTNERDSATWRIATGADVQTQWVEYSPAPAVSRGD